MVSATAHSSRRLRHFHGRLLGPVHVVLLRLTLVTLMLGPRPLLNGRHASVTCKQRQWLPVAINEADARLLELRCEPGANNTGLPRVLRAKPAHLRMLRPLAQQHAGGVVM